MQRDKIIVRTSVIGILANVFLAGFKAVVEAVSGSIAVILDAENNLSDALSSVITIVGTKLAGRKPDKKHPYGYGRVEYLTAVLVSVIVLYAGVTSLIESIKKIIRPETPDYSPVALIIIAVAVLVKIVLGRHVKGDTAARLREDVRRAVMAHEHALQMHGFYIDEATKEIRFDVVVDFAAPDRAAVYREIVSRVEALVPGYGVVATLDVDASD